MSASEMAAAQSYRIEDAVSFVVQRAAADTALQAWSVAAARLERVSAGKNIVFRVDAKDGRRYALRLHRPGYNSLPALRGEQMWARALVAAGIDAPVALSTRSGAGHSQVEMAGEQCLASLERWVDGTALGAIDGEDLGTGFAKLGAVMANIHNHAVAWRLPRCFVRHAIDADGLMGKRPLLGRFWVSPYLAADQRRLCDALRRRLHGLLAELPKRASDYSLIHADLHPGNVVATGERMHVIDFHDAGFGWHCYDFAVALSSYQSHHDFARLRDALFAGYRRCRRLPPDAATLLPMFQLVRNLALIGWLAASPALDPEIRQRNTATWMSLVEARAERVCRLLGI